MLRNTFSKRLNRITALLLLFSVAVPAGLQAKSLAEICLMTEIEKAESVPSNQMLPDHSCCPSESETSGHTESAHDDCESNWICACHIDHPPLSGQNWTAPHTVSAGPLTQIETISAEDHTDSFQHPGSAAETYTEPPIFLLNSSFLN